MHREIEVIFEMAKKNEIYRARFTELHYIV